MRPADRPFVDASVAQDPAVHAAAESAAAAFGLGDVERIRIGMNAIFTAGDVVLRVSRPSAPARVAIELARRLDAAGIPVPLPLRDESVEHEGLSVTAWERLRPDGSAIDWSEVGRAIARLHALDVDIVPDGHPLPSPRTFPWWEFDRMLAEEWDHLEPVPAGALRDVIERDRRWLDDIGRDAVVCHGDVHPGNVMMTARGPVLLDWDLLCFAHPAWDHAPMLTWAERWGGAPWEYDAFARGYGRSFRGDVVAETFAELRLVAATLMRSVAARHDPAAAGELERRLRWWRGDPDAPPWRAQ